MKKETYHCIMCGKTSDDPKEMYVLEDKINKKIYLRCRKCEEQGNINEIIIIKNHKGSRKR